MCNPKVNQIWRDKEPEPFLPESMRTIRIVAYHPDGGILYSHPKREDNGRSEIGWIALHYLTDSFELEKDVCEHKHTEDYWEMEKALPTFYICTDCGDTFPNTGDTNLWFPKVIERKL